VGVGESMQEGSSCYAVGETIYVHCFPGLSLVSSRYDNRYVKTPFVKIFLEFETTWGLQKMFTRITNGLLQLDMQNVVWRC
jgi:hypothetical protein